MYTDGVSEAMNINDQLYTDEQISNIFQSDNSNSLEDLVGSIVADVDKFVGEAEQSDDITMLAMRINGIDRKS